MSHTQPIISFFLVSDIHIGSLDGSDENSKTLTAGLEDMKKLSDGFTSLAFIGDNTKEGREDQVEGFYGIMDRYAPLSDDRILIALGNHDVRGPGPLANWSKDPQADNPFWKHTAKPLYMRKNARYMPKGQDKDAVYYDRWLDGYHFIVLNTENGVKDACTLSDRQLAWFEEKLSEAQDDRPIFVFIHQPLNDTHWRGNLLNGFGLEDEKVKAILKKYPQTIMMCGHIHNGFGGTEAVVREYGTTVEVPSYNESENGYKEKGIGYCVEVYEDRVVYRARNFAASMWLPEYDIVVRTPVLGAVYQHACAFRQEDCTEEAWRETEALKKEAEGIFARKYEQDHLEWDVTSLPPRQLFTKETLEETDRIAAELAAATERLVRR